MKKTMSVFVVIAIIVNLLAALSLTSFAVGEGTAVTAVDAGIITGDDTVKIPVTITGNPGIWSSQIFILYDAGAAYSSIDLTDSILADKEINIYESDMTVTAALEKYFELEELLENTKFNYEDARVVVITVENESLDNITGDGVFFNVVFGTSLIEAGEYPVNVLCSVYNTINVDDVKIEFTAVSGTLFVFDNALDYCNKFGHEFTDGEPCCLHGCGTENPDYNTGLYKVICDGEELGEVEAGAEVTLPVLSLKYDEYNAAFRFFTWSGYEVARGEYSSDNNTANGRIYTMTMPEGNVELTSVYYLVGDVDGNGKINAKDLSEIKKAITGSLKLDDAGNDRADVDCNDRNNASDISAIKKLIAGNYTVLR